MLRNLSEQYEDSMSALASTRRYISYGCTIYCAYQLGTYMYEQYFDYGDNCDSNVAIIIIK